MRVGRSPPRKLIGRVVVVVNGLLIASGAVPVEPGAEIEQEREDHEEPFHARHMAAGAPVPEGDVAERRPREDEETDQRDRPAVVGAAQDVVEEPQQEQDQPRRDEGKQCEEAAHVTTPSVPCGQATKEDAMPTKADFNAEEWSRLVEAPLLAGMRVSEASGGGKIDRKS